MKSRKIRQIGILAIVAAQFACLSSNFVPPPTPSLAVIGASCNTNVENSNLFAENPSVQFPVMGGTSIPQTTATISTENASQVVRLARWGKGAATDFKWISDGQKIALTTLYGVYVYESNGLNLESFFPFEQDGALVASNLSSDGEMLATSLVHGPIQIWNINEKSLVREFQIEDSFVGHLAISQDGALIAADVGNGKMLVWSIHDGKMVQKFSSGIISGIGFSPDGKFIAVEDSNILQLWRIEDGVLLHELNNGDIALVLSFDFSPDMQTIVTSNFDGKFRLWRLSDGKLIREWYSGEYSPDNIAFSPDGKWLAFDGVSSGVYLIRADNGKLERVYKGETGFFGFSPDGKSIATKSSFATVQILDVNDGQIIGELDTSKATEGLAVSPNGKLVATGGPYLINIWDVSTGTSICQISAHRQTVFSLVFSPDGNSIVSGGYDGMMRLWSIENGTLVREIQVVDKKGDNLVYAVAISPDGHLLAAGNSNPTLYLAMDGSIIWQIDGDRELVRDVAFSPDGNILAVAAYDTTELWSVSTKQMIRELDGFVLSLAFSPDGKFIAAASDREVLIWQIDNGTKKYTLGGYKNIVNDVAFSPDGKLLVTADVEGSIRIWSVKDGGLLKILNGHKGYRNGTSSDVNKVAFNPDGTLLFSTGIDGTVGVWGIP